jgi:hypothetical protein
MHFANSAQALPKGLTMFTWIHLHRIIARELSYINALGNEYCMNPKKVMNQQVNKDGIHPFTAKVSAMLHMGRCTYENMRMWSHQENGFAYAERIPPAPHCSRECMQIAKQGMIPISEMLPLGETSIRGDCKCILVFSRTIR